MISYGCANCAYDAKDQAHVQKLFRFISDFYNRIGFSMYSDLKIVKDPKHGVPQFCSKARNPGFPMDFIFLHIDSYSLWCKVAYQLGHEYAHYIMAMDDQNDLCFVSWIEESVAECASLIVLKNLSLRWLNCELHKINPGYAKSIRKYLKDEIRDMRTTGTRRLSFCRDLNALRQLNDSATEHREDRSFEIAVLFEHASKYEDFAALLRYRKFVIPGSILLDSDTYILAYPNNKAVSYLCSLQPNKEDKNNDPN